MGEIQCYKEETCLKCSDKYFDCRDYRYCMIVEASSINGFGYLGRKKEVYKKTPKWCPKKKAPLSKVLE